MDERGREGPAADAIGRAITGRAAPGRREALKGLVGLAGLAALGPALATRSAAGETSVVKPTSKPPETGEDALEILRAGNHRFFERKPYVRSTEEIERLWTELSTGQSPFATILGCSDSRLSPEIIFDQFFGSLFVVREAGNVAASPTNLGSLEYGHAVLGAKLLLVFGHSSCGAVTAAFNRDRPGANMDAIVDAIVPSIQGAATVDDAVVANVRGVQAQIRERSSLLRTAESAAKLKIAGAVYDIRSGVVTFLDA